MECPTHLVPTVETHSEADNLGYLVIISLDGVYPESKNVRAQLIQVSGHFQDVKVRWCQREFHSYCQPMAFGTMYLNV